MRRGRCLTCWCLVHLAVLVPTLKGLSMGSRRQGSKPGDRGQVFRSAGHEALGRTSSDKELPMIHGPATSSRRQWLVGSSPLFALMCLSTAAAGLPGQAGAAPSQGEFPRSMPPPPPPPPPLVDLSRDPRLRDPQVYAVVSSSTLGPVATVSLDFRGRVRSVAYFFDSRAGAEGALDVIQRSSPSAVTAAGKNGLVVTALPLSQALALTMQEPFKVQGLPGYFCHRFLVGGETRDTALGLSGLASMADNTVPLFFSKADLQDGRQLRLFFRARDAAAAAAQEDAKRVEEAKASALGVTDLKAVSLQWLGMSTGGGVGDPTLRNAQLVLPVEEDASVSRGRARGEQEDAGRTRLMKGYSQDPPSNCILAIEPNL